jgi:hypothetical protein
MLAEPTKAIKVLPYREGELDRREKNEMTMGSLNRSPFIPSLLPWGDDRRDQKGPVKRAEEKEWMAGSSKAFG